MDKNNQQLYTARIFLVLGRNTARKWRCSRLSIKIPALCKWRVYVYKRDCRERILFFLSRSLPSIAFLIHSIRPHFLFPRRSYFLKSRTSLEKKKMKKKTKLVICHDTMRAKRLVERDYILTDVNYERSSLLILLIWIYIYYLTLYYTFVYSFVADALADLKACYEITAVDSAAAATAGFRRRRNNRNGLPSSTGYLSTLQPHWSSVEVWTSRHDIFTSGAASAAKSASGL